VNKKKIIASIGVCLLLAIIIIDAIGIDTSPKPLMIDEDFVFFNENIRLSEEYKVKVVNVNFSFSASILDDNEERVWMGNDGYAYTTVTLSIIRDRQLPEDTINDQQFFHVDNFTLADYQSIDLDDKPSLRSLYDSRIVLEKDEFDSYHPLVDYEWLNVGLRSYNGAYFTLTFRGIKDFRTFINVLKIDLDNDEGVSIILAERPYDYCIIA
jgi:hypothetical protein